MTTAIIDYGSGNLHSALKAFERAAGEAGGTRALNILREEIDRVMALSGACSIAELNRELLALPAPMRTLASA